jgi:NitT/TauT family transport system permease protein
MKSGTSSTSTLEPKGAGDPAVTSIPEEGPSPLFLAHVRQLQFERRMVRVAQAAAIVAFFALWEIAPRSHWVNPLLTSYPSAVWRVFVEMFEKGTIFNHVWVTFEETIVGFVVGLTGGIAVAIALWWSRFAHRVVDPFLVVLNALPKTALAPIFYIWLGAELSIYGIAIAVGLFITIIMVYNGFNEVDPNKVKLARTFGANRMQILQKVILPGSVPTMVAALKINIGLSLVGVIVGEFQSSKAGLGYLIVYGSQIFQMNMAMMAITILAIISTAMYVGIFYFERAVLWHRQQQ